MFGDFLQPTHILLIFIVLLLLFGPQKLPQLGKGLGEAIRGFKEGLHTSPPNQPSVPGTTEPLAMVPAGKDDATRT